MECLRGRFLWIRRIQLRCEILLDSFVKRQKHSRTHWIESTHGFSSRSRFFRYSAPARTIRLRSSFSMKSKIASCSSDQFITRDLSSTIANAQLPPLPYSASSGVLYTSDTSLRCIQRAVVHVDKRLLVPMQNTNQSLVGQSRRLRLSRVHRTRDVDNSICSFCSLSVRAKTETMRKRSSLVRLRASG